MSGGPRTIVQKIWDSHVMEGEPPLLYVDLHLVHEVTSPQAFESLRMAGREVRRPDLTLATMDHNVPTDPQQVSGAVPLADEMSVKQMQALHRRITVHGEALDAEQRERIIAIADKCPVHRTLEGELHVHTESAD